MNIFYLLYIFYPYPKKTTRFLRLTHDIHVYLTLFPFSFIFYSYFLILYLYSLFLIPSIFYPYPKKTTRFLRVTHIMCPYVRAIYRSICPAKTQQNGAIHKGGLVRFNPLKIFYSANSLIKFGAKPFLCTSQGVPWQNIFRPYFTSEMA